MNETTKSRSRITTFLLLAATLLVVLPPFVVDVGHPSPVRSMESICMHTSLETWVRQRGGETDAWWNPSWDGGEIRIEKPPLLVWLNMAAWSGLDPAEARMEDLALRARLMNILVVLIGLGALFGIGVTLYDRTTGGMAALITGSGYLLIKQSHSATYDAQLMGWATLAVALGIAAMRSAPGQGGRRILFWALSALALGAAMMTKGPIGAVWVVAPLALFIALGSTAPLKDALGLAASSLVGAALMAPWFLHTLRVSADAMSSLADEYKPIDRDQFRPLYYYLALLVFVFPWTFWWIPSFRSPFQDRTEGRMRFFPLAWFALTFLFLSAWPMRHERYLVPLLPAAGLMCAVYLRGVFREPARQGYPAKSLRVFWWIALIVSVVVPAWIAMDPALLAAGVIEEAKFSEVSPLLCLLGGLSLVALSWFGLRRRDLPLRPSHFVPVAIWAILLTTLAYHSYSLADHQHYPWRANAERFARAVGNTPVYYLHDPQLDRPRDPEMGLKIYSRKIIRRATREQWEQIQSQGHPFYILVPDRSVLPKSAREIHNDLGEVTDDESTWRLLEFKPASAS